MASSIAIGTVTSRNCGIRYAEELEDLGGGKPPVDHHFDQLEEPGDQQDEREDPQPEDERRDDLTEYIAVEDLPHRGGGSFVGSNE